MSCGPERYGLFSVLPVMISISRSMVLADILMPAPVPAIYYIGPPNDGSVFQNGQADCSSNATPIPSKCVKGVSAFLIADQRDLGIDRLCA